MSYKLATFGDICRFSYGKSLPSQARHAGAVSVFGSNGRVGEHREALVDGPAIIIGRKGSVGEIHLSEDPSWPIDTTYYISRKETDCDLKWLAYALNASQIKNLNKSAAVPGLNRDDAYRLPILVPSLKEQKRIAAILDKADQLRVGFESH